jgi:hypothetical protein
MLRFITDQNFDGRIIRGLRARVPDIDLVTAHRAGISDLEDPDLLRWTAEHGRILITHDKRTIPDELEKLVASGLELPGVILVAKKASLGRLIDDLVIAVCCGEPQDFRNNIYRLPFPP